MEGQTLHQREWSAYSACRVIVILGALALGSAFYSHLLPNPLAVGGFVISVAGLVLSMISTGIIGLFTWRKSSRFWMGPAALCIAFLLSVRVATKVAIVASDSQFKRQMADYLRVLDFIRGGNAPCDSNLRQIDIDRRPRHVDIISAACCPDGSTVVEFSTITGVPLLHVGYIFRKSTSANDCLEETVQRERGRWPYQRHIVGNWYRCSDQPGL